MNKNFSFPNYYGKIIKAKKKFGKSFECMYYHFRIQLGVKHRQPVCILAFSYFW